MGYLETAQMIIATAKEIAHLIIAATLVGAHLVVAGGVTLIGCTERGEGIKEAAFEITLATQVDILCQVGLLAMGKHPLGSGELALAARLELLAGFVPLVVDGVGLLLRGYKLIAGHKRMAVAWFG